jgi:hypothetical protein
MTHANPIRSGYLRMVNLLVRHLRMCSRRKILVQSSFLFADSQPFVINLPMESLFFLTGSHSSF